MPVEDTKIVKSITAKAGGKSGTYWSVTWQDGKIDNIFNAEWLPLLEQSQKDNRLLHFTKEKKGAYYNIVSLELAALPDSPLVQEAVKLGVKVIPDDTKTRSMAISYAKDLVMAGKIELRDMSAYADRFIDYILNIRGKEGNN